MTETNRLIIDTMDVSKELKELDGELTSDIFGLSRDDRIRCQSPLDYSLRASFTGEGFLLEGTAATTVSCTCDRCLKEYDKKVVVPNVCHYYEGLDHKSIDATDDVREDVVINFPDKCLCSEGCEGICPQCGKNLNDESCDCPGAPEAPRAWDTLDGLNL